jgi:hypothetical protein
MTPARGQIIAPLQRTINTESALIPGLLTAYTLQGYAQIGSMRNTNGLVYRILRLASCAVIAGR